MATNRRDKLLETAYLACFVIYTTISIIAFSPAYDKFDHIIGQGMQLKVANWGAFAVLAIIYIFKEHQSVKEITAELFIVVLFIITTFTNQTVDSVFLLTQWTTFAVVGMFIACATVTTFKRITAVSLITTLITVAAFFVAANMGIIANFTEGHNGATAHFMGFSYYSHPSYYMTFAWLAYMYLRGEKIIGWIELFAEAAALYLLHSYTTCRLANVCTFVALILYIVFVKLDLIKLRWKFTHIVSVAGFSAAAIFTLLTGYFFSYENAVLAKLNTVINGRLNLVNLAFDRYNITLFGRIIKPLEGEWYFYLDSGYAYALFGCGLVFFLVVLGIYSYMCHHACKTNDRCLLVWLATLAVFGIVGDVWVHISYTPLILGLFIFIREAVSNKKTNTNTVLSTDTEKTTDTASIR